MAERAFVPLRERGVLTVAGPDRRSFLQGLVSNDVEKVAGDRALYAALLTAQGKYLHDFFIAERHDALILDCEAARLADLQRRLSMYRLRANVTLAAEPSLTVFAVFGAGALAALGLPEEPGAAKPFAGGVAFVDPRLAALGARLLVPPEAGSAALREAGFVEQDFAAYDRLRLGCGVADGSRDLPVEKAILLEAGFDELNGVDWKKGCYIGQELTARTKYRGLIKKRLLPVELDGPVPASGAIISLNGGEAGEMRSGQDGLGLALLRLEAVDAAESSGQVMTAGDTSLRPVKPGWVKLQS